MQRSTRRACLTGAIVAVAALAFGVPMVGPAVARCARDSCTPEPGEPPPPPPDGRLLNFLAHADFCEPRRTPYNTITYNAPGASVTTIAVQTSGNGPFAGVVSYYGSQNNNVHLVHASHGTYRVRSFGPTEALVDERYFVTC
jgi:hypothetical protein